MAGHGGEAPSGVGPSGGEELRDLHLRGVARASQLVRRQQHCCHCPSHTPIQSLAPTPVRTPLPLPSRPFMFAKSFEREVGKVLVLGRGKR